MNSVLTGNQPQALHGSQGQGTTLNNHFEVIPANRTWRVPPQRKPSVDGPQSAIVTGPAGEEIFCDEHGRVRVRFHWDRYCPGNEDSSCWIRVSQAWAGTGFGNLAIPRVGQEVIVDFLNGDPDQPIIMGRTYHQDNRSPGSLPGTKTQMAIRSKTYKGDGFNELRFEDATGQEELYLHAQKDMTTEVQHDRVTTVNNNHTELVKSNQSVTVNKNQVTTVMQNKVETVQMTSTETVGLAKTSTVGAAYELTVGAAMNTAVALSQTELVGMNKSITVSENFAIKTGSMFTLDAEESLIITVGESKMIMKQDGSILLKGVKVLVNADQYIKYAASKISVN